jgi:hypothetical protein
MLCAHHAAMAPVTARPALPAPTAPRALLVLIPSRSSLMKRRSSFPLHSSSLLYVCSTPHALHNPAQLELASASHHVAPFFLTIERCLHLLGRVATSSQDAIHRQESQAPFCRRHSSSAMSASPSQFASGHGPAPCPRASPHLHASLWPTSRAPRQPAWAGTNEHLC